MAQSEQPALRPRRPDILSTYRTILLVILRSPAAWLLAVLYLLCTILFIPLGGDPNDLLMLLPYHVYYLLILLLIIPLTQAAFTPPWNEPAPYARRRLWWQFIIALLFLALFLLYTFALFEPQLLPGIGSALSAWSSKHLALRQAVAFAWPLLMLGALPLLSMFLSGARRRELGFGRDYRSWRVIALSCALPVCAIIAVMVLNGRSPLRLLAQLASSFLIAGLPEEIFFRGILQTRLTRLCGPQWGIVLSTLLFAAAHSAADFSAAHSLPLALASTILQQAPVGLLLAVIFLRTRSLLAGTVFHTLLDTFSGLLFTA